MSLPRVIAQVAFGTTRAVGKAFVEMGRQAARNATYKQDQAESGGGDSGAAGAGAKGANPTQALSRQMRMTIDEARLILNVKPGATTEEILKNYEHLFSVNAPPPPPEAPAEPTPEQPARRPGRRHTKPAKIEPPPYSHYLQSKVVRARERLEAELKAAEEAEALPKGEEGAEGAQAAEGAKVEEGVKAEGAEEKKGDGKA